MVVTIDGAQPIQYCIGCVVAPTDGCVAFAAPATFAVAAVILTTIAPKSIRNANLLKRGVPPCMRERILCWTVDIFGKSHRSEKSCVDVQLKTNYCLLVSFLVFLQCYLVFVICAFAFRPRCGE